MAEQHSACARHMTAHSAPAWDWMMIDRAPMATLFYIPAAQLRHIPHQGQGWTDGLDKVGVSE